MVNGIPFDKIECDANAGEYWSIQINERTNPPGEMMSFAEVNKVGIVDVAESVSHLHEPSGLFLCGGHLKSGGSVGSSNSV
jgi:hypothetical protein